MTIQMPLPRGPHPRLREPGELAAALPALLGFHPANSLAVICLGTGPAPGAAALRLVLRCDLSVSAGQPGRDMPAALNRLAALCAREQSSAAIAFLIDGDHDETSPRYDHTHVHETLAAELAIGLRDYGIPLLGAHATRSITTGTRWWSLLGDSRTGAVPDPASSAVAAAQVYAGRAIHESRSQLTDLLAPESAICAQVHALLQQPSPARSARAHLRYLLRAATGGAVPMTPAQLTGLARGLAIAPVRDALYALATSALADPAERFWLALTRNLPTPARAHAATLLGFSAYIRGDGPFTGVALATALDADPDHRMAGLLTDALHAGMRPETISMLGQTSYECAHALGVTMPAQRPDPAP